MASIQAKGKEMVLDLFQNRDVEAWAIFQGKQFLFKGIGEDSLSDTIDMLVRAASNSMYRLNVYEDINDIKSIKEKTPCDGSFNFVLNVSNIYSEVGDDNKSGKHTINSITKKIEDRIAEKLGIILDSEDQEPEPATIGDILQKPGVMKEYLELFGQIKALFTGTPQPPMQLAAVGEVTRTTENETVVEKEYTPDEQTRLITVINTLQKKDPNILVHLEKLAAMNDAKFKGLLSMLDMI